MKDQDLTWISGVSNVTTSFKCCIPTRVRGNGQKSKLCLDGQSPLRACGVFSRILTIQLCHYFPCECIYIVTKMAESGLLESFSITRIAALCANGTMNNKVQTR